MLVKSPTDTSSYKISKLNNGLEVLLISDPSITISFVSMIVHTGSFLETTTFGLAHFLEHILFMGNKKYPIGGQYFEYINSHGGKTNAFTDSLNTCFYYSIDSKYLNKSLDMFGHFFIDPLFDYNSIQKEIQIVHEEYEKNIHLDRICYRQALKLLTKENHPFRNFDIGSTETLRKPSIREDLMEFYRKYYVANNMKLIIMNNQPFEETEKLIYLFSEIPSSSDSFQYTFGYPFKASNVIKLVPVSNSKIMLLTWALPYHQNYKLLKLLRYIFYLFERETNGSLGDMLIENTLVDTISVSSMSNFGDYIIMCMEMKLTDYGLANMDLIVNLINSYVNILKQNKLNKKHLKTFEKCMKLNFYFDEPKRGNDKVMNIVNNICFYNATLDEAISNYKLEYENSDLVSLSYLNYLDEMAFDKMNIIIGSASYSHLVKETEPYFGFKYLLEKNHYYNPRIKFNFNDIYQYGNFFIPKQLMIYRQKGEYKYPVKLDFPFEAWYKYENISLPKVCFVVSITLPKLYETVESYVITQIYLKLVKKSLRHIMYDIILCDMQYSITLLRDTIFIKVYAFNDNIEKIVDNIFHSLMEQTVSFTKFASAKDSYQKFIEERLLDPPYEKLNEIINSAVFTKQYNYEDQKKVISRIHQRDLFRINLEDITEIKCLANGNITKRNCIKLYQTVQKFFHSKIKDHQNWEIQPIISGTKIIHPTDRRKDDKNILFCQMFCIEELPATDEFYNKYLALNLVVNKILSDKFFDTLRTKAQLGYIVRNGSDTIGSDKILIYQKYLIQSSSHSIDELQEHISKFFVDEKKFIDNLTEEGLQKYIEACSVNAMVKEFNVCERTSDLFEQIFSEKYTFVHKEKLVSALKEINTSILRAFYEKYFISLSAKKIIIEYH